MRIPQLVVIAVLAVAARGVRAQGTPAGQLSPDQQKAALIQMKSDLRNLVVAQEAYFADHSAYAADMQSLKFRPAEPVSVRLTTTQDKGWAAEARSTTLPTVACVIWINVAEQYRPRVGGVLLPNGEGEPACGEIEKR